MFLRKNIASEKSPLKYVAALSLVLIFILLAGSIVFYKERELYIDAPHLLFRIINLGQFWEEEHRYGAIITQVLPFVGTKLHLPLAWLMILYSANFYLFYLLVSVLLVYNFRNYRLAILLGLYFTLFVSDTYYWANNEVHQGTTWLLLSFALNFAFAEKSRSLLLTSLLFILFFWLAIWTHPLVMLAAVYLWFFFMTDKSLWPYTKMQSVLFSFFLIILSYIKFEQGKHHGYDGTKIEMLTNFNYQKIRIVLSSPQLHFFFSSCAHQYKFFSLLFVTGLIGALLAKRYLAFAWTILVICGYLALTSITFWDVTSRSYMESEYMPLVVICCTPFVYYVLPKMNLKFAIGLFALIYLVRIAVIYRAAPPFTNRLTIMENIHKKMKEKHLTKVIIPEPVNDVDDALITNWAAPVESLFISKLEGETPQSTFIFLNRNQLTNADTTAKNVLVEAWERVSTPGLNPFYFQIDTTTTYKVIPYAALMD